MKYNFALFNSIYILRSPAAPAYNISQSIGE